VKRRRVMDAATIARVFWLRWLDCKHTVTIVQPESLLRWHRRGWIWLASAEAGRDLRLWQGRPERAISGLTLRVSWETPLVYRFHAL
jgi:hypothetical protein